MATESLIFDILARDSASRTFKSVAQAAAGAAGSLKEMGSKLSDVDGRVAKARVDLFGDKEAQASLDKLSARLLRVGKTVANPNIKLDGAARAQAEIAALDLELDKLGGQGGSAEAATASMGGLAGPAGMGAVIGAGVALAPVIATVGLGLGGLGLAAAAVVKNQRLMSATIAPLKAQYLGFSKALQPVVLSDFGDAVRVAGGLLHDLQPVSQAAGKALGGFLHQIDAEFRSNNWQNFFKFMAQTAGPDIKLLGNAFVSLTGTLPTLLEALQPVATSLLTIVNYTGQAIRLSELASTNFSGLGKAAQKSGDGFNATTTGLKAAIPGLQAADSFAKTLGQGLDVLYGNSKPAAAGLKATGAAAEVAGAKLQTMGQAVTALTTAESKSLDTQLAYSGALITAKDDSVSLRTALKASAGAIGLHTAAQRASFQAANTYIGDLEQVAQKSWASGKGTDGAIAAIRGGLPILDSAKTKNRNYWQEVKTLTDWLHKLENIKPIRDDVHLSGSGSWTFGLSGTGSFPSRHIKGRAAGWRVPGHGSGDTVPAMLTPGEAVVPRRLVPAVAPFLSAHKVPGFATGGLVPSYTGKVAGLVPWGQRDWNATILAMTHAFARAGKAQQSAFSSVSGAASFGVTRWAPLILKVLAMLGQSSANLGAVEHRMQQESGGNPFAINLTDSNAAAGDPSRGLMQTIGSTFARYRSWSLPNNIYNPEANIFAGLNYALHAYAGRSLSSVMLQPGGYDNGGWLKPGLTLAYNGTGRPEQVIPHSRAAAPVRIELVVRTGYGATDLDRAIVAIIQKHVDINGGDTQVALGSHF